MASSKLMMNMSSSTTRNSDLIRRKSSNSSSSSTSTNHNHNHKRTSPASTINNNSGNFQMTLDSLSPTLHNNNNQQQPPPLENTLLDAQINLLDAGTAINNSVAPLCRQESERASSKIAEDVWKEIVAGGRSCKQEVADEMMTLEDFLAKAGAVEEEDVKMVPRLPSGGGSGMFSYDPPKVNVDGFGMGVEEMGVGGRGKRRAMLETLDKAAQQRQRRMIKNRESAARSRERKQAYQAELESLAVKLEEENEMLLKVKTEQTRKRYKQLMENIIPVTEKHRPRRYALTRARSMEW